jgi:hypothetical protein
MVRVTRVFREEGRNHVTSLRSLTRVVEVISVPRRSEQLLVPDLTEPLVIERIALLATFPDRTPPTMGPRVTVTTAPESIGRYKPAVDMGWRAV